ncbi:nucleotidyltransferase domain-containing protein [Streptomyces sp. NPDC005180]|uniref:nucleotidyltransferase domain-containing protein n=1 Tax=Streptomyces sp. NPDC005180 TaxID=3156868 RepID=UPI0033B28884
MDAQRTERQLSMIREVRDLGLQLWLRGGWAMDFWLGEVTREHEDVDWFAWAGDAERLRSLLVGRGYEVLREDDQQLDVVRDGEEHGFAFVTRRRPDGRVVVAGGPWAGTPWPEGLLDGVEPGRLGGLECPVASPEAQIEIKRMTPVWVPERPRREKDAVDVARLEAALAALHATDDTLVHEGGAFLNFRTYPAGEEWGHGFRWLHTKRFRLPAAPVTDARLLAALLSHEQFRDDYAGGGVLPQGRRHGSFWRRLITPAAYEPVTSDAAARLLRTWADQFGPVPEALGADLRKEAFACLAAAGTVLHLTGVGEDDFHDWGGVHGEFHELVAIDRTAGHLTLLVAADD